MATITGFTAERMLEIEGSSVIDAEIINGNLILTKHDGTTIDAGPVAGPQGPPGPEGPAAPPNISAIPGEVRLWSGQNLPLLADYGKWVWADGGVYAVATYPKSAAHIGTQWRTFAGASDPGPSNFRVPDLRGLSPVGMDAMPGGARANRLTRSVSINLAGKTGEELHTLIASEIQHIQEVLITGTSSETGAQGQYMITTSYAPSQIAIGGTVVMNGQTAHENMQPTVFVPYIVKLD